MYRKHVSLHFIWKRIVCVLHTTQSYTRYTRQLLENSNEVCVHVTMHLPFPLSLPFTLLHRISHSVIFHNHRYIPCYICKDCNCSTIIIITMLFPQSFCVPHHSYLRCIDCICVLLIHRREEKKRSTKWIVNVQFQWHIDRCHGLVYALLLNGEWKQDEWCEWKTLKPAYIPFGECTFSKHAVWTEFLRSLFHRQIIIVPHIRYEQWHIRKKIRSTRWNAWKKEQKTSWLRVALAYVTLCEREGRNYSHLSIHCSCCRTFIKSIS